MCVHGAKMGGELVKALAEMAVRADSKVVSVVHGEEAEERRHREWQAMLGW